MLMSFTVTQDRYMWLRTGKGRKSQQQTVTLEWSLGHKCYSFLVEGGTRYKQQKASLLCWRTETLSWPYELDPELQLVPGTTELPRLSSCCTVCVTRWPQQTGMSLSTGLRKTKRWAAYVSSHFRKEVWLFRGVSNCGDLRKEQSKVRPKQITHFWNEFSWYDSQNENYREQNQSRNWILSDRETAPEQLLQSNSQLTHTPHQCTHTPTRKGKVVSRTRSPIMVHITGMHSRQGYRHAASVITPNTIISDSVYTSHSI